jgi:hypothetical protein
MHKNNPPGCKPLILDENITINIPNGMNGTEYLKY